ncbi:hypothetical protein FRB94_008686 [Tulasnella sp. JGI-2019a]|nr:hypothetical protein FRB93_006938 [Tulasnella sp. JGI-2019a]KAG8995949.1 hypothetical protein FRB94_008686 [Tulasnella sp. JGI-2019a]
MLQLSQASSLTRGVIIFGLFSVVLTFFAWSNPSYVDTSSYFSGSSATTTSKQSEFAVQGCSPEDWAGGSWQEKSHPVVVHTPDDAFPASGFLGCASNREVEWHLSRDHPEYNDWRGNVSRWDWQGAGRCSADVPNDRETMVIDLVENGGWLLIGDSVTEEHFFSVSCTLYPHVIATPDYTGRYDWDRAWPQNLYLNPNSPLVSRIEFPEGFDMKKTPLVTFRRVDLLFNRTEIASIHYGGRTPPANDSLFGSEASWDMSPVDYFAIFLSPAPFNYHTLIVSTGGHWSEKLFSGIAPPAPKLNNTNSTSSEEDEHPRLPLIANLFRATMDNWSYQAGRYLDSPEGKRRPREVIVRPYLPGDDNCHSAETLSGGPQSEPKKLGKWTSYNWAWIPKFNDRFESAVSARRHPNVHYLPIERPGRLRPDAHALSDCLHLTVGAGVIEGWTQYIHYYTSAYLPLVRRGQRFAISRIPL